MASSRAKTVLKLILISIVGLGIGQRDIAAPDSPAHVGDHRPPIRIAHQTNGFGAVFMTVAGCVGISTIMPVPVVK